ncbi:unnamed protein product [Moneuplotes crassus]|uniref:Uncharacterized protein n=1 Tax=Euplotes crassus TaxID=5936 RepID=A0AAD1U8J8_EUPCR|nr:unnamed protein product [Moneuplotes crassus]
MEMYAYICRDIRSLLFNFSHSINILKYYGSLSQCNCLLLGLCRQTRELWEKNSQAYAYGLVADGTRRTLICYESFDSTVTDYFENIRDISEFHLFEYVLQLQSEDCIRKFCEFIKGFKNRSFVKFKRIEIDNVHTAGMTCALLNSPYDVLRELSLDTSCIQINKLQNFIPYSAKDLLKYTHELDLSTITQGSHEDLAKFVTYDCVKGINQFNFDSKVETLLDSDQYKDIIPVSIRQSCRQVCIKRFPKNDLLDTKAIGNVSQELAKVFPKFKETGSRLSIYRQFLFYSKELSSLLQEGVSLTSEFYTHPSFVILKDCNVWCYDYSLKAYLSFKVSKMLCKQFGIFELDFKPLKGFTVVSNDSILELQHIQSVQRCDSENMEIFEEYRIKIEQGLDYLHKGVNPFFIEGKDFEFIDGNDILIYCKPSKCEHLKIQLCRGVYFKKTIAALKKVRTEFLFLQVYDLNFTHLKLIELLAFKVTDISFDIREGELSKITLKEKRALRSAILGVKSLRSVTIIMNRKRQLLRRTDVDFKKQLARIFGKNLKVEITHNMPFEETSRYY